MEIEDYNYEKNSNTISKEERDAFIDRFKRACRAKGMTVQQLHHTWQDILGLPLHQNWIFREMLYPMLSDTMLMLQIPIYASNS